MTTTRIETGHPFTPARPVPALLDGTWWLALVAAAPAVVITVLLLARGLVAGPTVDGAVFALIGDALLDGRLPYRDLFDHKPPGIFLLNAAGGLVLGGLGPWAVAWLMSAASTIVALVVLAWALLRSGVPSLGVSVAMLSALPLVAGYRFVLGGGQTESTALAFATIGVVTVVSTATVRWAALAGAVTAVGCLITLQALPAVAAVVLWLAIDRTRWPRLIAFVVGGVAVGVLVGAWLVAAGIWVDALDLVVGYNRTYVTVNQGARAESLATMMVASVAVLPIIVAAVARIAAIRYEPLRPLEVVAAWWVLSWLAFVLAQGLFFEHYATALAPALIVLAARPLGRLLDEVQRPLFAIIAVAVVVLGVPHVATHATEGEAVAPASLPAAVHEIQARTGPHDRIFVWGNEPVVYLAADRAPAGRYVYTYPLTMRGYATPDGMAAILDAWNAAPPALIVDATTNPDRVGGYSLSGALAPDGPDAILDPLRRWVLDRYEVVARAGTWSILAPRTPTT